VGERGFRFILRGQGLLRVEDLGLFRVEGLSLFRVEGLSLFWLQVVGLLRVECSRVY
jgi:hypothetical protein